MSLNQQQWPSHFLIPQHHSYTNTPTPTLNVAWSKDTKPPAADQSYQSVSFQLVTDLICCYVRGKNIPVVYEGVSADGFIHTARFEDSAKLTVHDSNVQLLNQPDFLNIPKTPLDYRNEVGTGLSLEEAQALAIPLTISPLQK